MMHIYLANPRDSVQVDRAIDIAAGRGGQQFGARRLYSLTKWSTTNMWWTACGSSAQCSWRTEQVPDGATVRIEVPRQAPRRTGGSQAPQLNVFDATRPPSPRCTVKSSHYPRGPRGVFDHMRDIRKRQTIGHLMPRWGVDSFDAGDRRRCRARAGENRILAFVTQTTLPVDEHRIHRRGTAPAFRPQGACQRGHLLRHAKPARTAASIGRREVLRSNPRAVQTQLAPRKWPTKNAKPVKVSWTARKICIVSGSTALYRWASLPALLGALEILVQGVIAQLREWGNEVAEELSKAHRTYVISRPPQHLT